MKTNEIRVGRYYTNGRELVRLVLNTIDSGKALNYRTTAKGRGRGRVGDERCVGTQDFADWAVADVTDRYVNVQGV